MNNDYIYIIYTYIYICGTSALRLQRFAEAAFVIWLTVLLSTKTHTICVYMIYIYIYTCIYTHWVSFLIFGSENLIAEGATAVLAQVWECTSHRMPHEATCSWRSAGSDNIPNFSGFLGNFPVGFNSRLKAHETIAIWSESVCFPDSCCVEHFITCGVKQLLIIFALERPKSLG